MRGATARQAPTLVRTMGLDNPLGRPPPGQTDYVPGEEEVWGTLKKVAKQVVKAQALVRQCPQADPSLGTGNERGGAPLIVPVGCGGRPNRSVVLTNYVPSSASSGAPSLVAADEVGGSAQPKFAQGGCRQARAVTLVTHHDEPGLVIDVQRGTVG